VFSLLSNGDHFLCIKHHYKITLIPVCVMAAILGYGALMERLARGTSLPRERLRQGVLTYLISAAALSAYTFGAGPFCRHFDSRLHTLTPDARFLAEVKRVLPQDAVLYASHRAGALFTNRPHLHIIGVPHPSAQPEPDFLLVDTEYAWGDLEGARTALAHWLADPRYCLIAAQGSLYWVGKKACVDKLALGVPAKRLQNF
jgi:hypothetical protein